MEILTLDADRSTFKDREHHSSDLILHELFVSLGFV